MGLCSIRLLVRSYDNFQICHSNFGCRDRCLRLPHIIWVTAIQITTYFGVDALPTSTTTRWRQRRKSDKLIALNALCAANWNVKPNLQIIQMGFTLRFFFSHSFIFIRVNFIFIFNLISPSIVRWRCLFQTHSFVAMWCAVRFVCRFISHNVCYIKTHQMDCCLCACVYGGMTMCHCRIPVHSPKVHTRAWFGGEREREMQILCV